jgi:hypothetical protein
MTTMLDKMSRAIVEAGFPAERMSMDEAEVLARAALQAIREVDEDTFRAGEMAMPGYNDCGPGEPWLAMIDHILSQGHGK